MLSPRSAVALLGLMVAAGSLAGTACTTSEPRAAVAESPPVETMPQGAAGDLVRRAIEAHGGWNAWSEKQSVEYVKTTTRFDAEGEPERTIVQRHLYRLRPELGVRIEYHDEEGRDVALLNDGDEAWMVVDGEVDESREARDRAWNSTFGSHYVFAMPFKLTDPGAILSAAGDRVLPDGTRARGVRVDYEEGAGSAGGMHVWTYWFAEEDGRLVANHLTYGPDPGDHDTTEYLEYDEVDGILLPGKRVGYLSDAEQTRGRKISEIRYEEVRFDVATEPETFRPAGGDHEEAGPGSLDSGGGAEG